MATNSAPAQPAPPPLPPERLSELLAGVVREALPAEYEKKEDWQRTKRITTGLNIHGKLRSLRIHRRKKEVPHGLWKHYRVTLIDPEKSYSVDIADLRSVGPGRAACTLVIEADLRGWARLRHYNRGLHLGTITVEGDSSLRISVDCEVGFKIVPGEYLPAIALRPKVTGARVDVEEFTLNRVGEIEGKLAKEMGRGLKHVIENRLEKASLKKKLNEAINRKRDRLTLDLSALATADAIPRRDAKP